VPLRATCYMLGASPSHTPATTNTTAQRCAQRPFRGCLHHPLTTHHPPTDVLRAVRPSERVAATAGPAPFLT
jgi:hypothetical protein